MSVYNLAEHKGANKSPRLLINGKRVSLEKYEHVEQMGYMYGTISNVHTKGVIHGDTIRRTNYKTITLKES